MWKGRKDGRGTGAGQDRCGKVRMGGGGQVKGFFGAKIISPVRQGSACEKASFSWLECISSHCATSASQTLGPQHVTFPTPKVSRFLNKLPVFSQ